MRRRMGGGADRDRAGDLVNLGFALQRMGRPGEAEPLLREALAISRGLDDLPRLMNTLEAVAQAVWKRDPIESEKLYAEELALARNAYPPGSGRMCWVLRNYAYTVRHNRGAAQAEPLLREALATARGAYRGPHEETAQCLQHLAVALRELGKGEEARELLGEEVEMYTKLFGAENPRTRRAIELLEERGTAWR